MHTPNNRAQNTCDNNRQREKCTNPQLQLEVFTLLSITDTTNRCRPKKENLINLSFVVVSKEFRSQLEEAPTATDWTI